MPTLDDKLKRFCSNIFNVSCKLFRTNQNVQMVSIDYIFLVILFFHFFVLIYLMFGASHSGPIKMFRSFVLIIYFI